MLTAGARLRGKRCRRRLICVAPVEHLQLNEARVAALGAKDLFHSINVTCANHEGDGLVTFQQWDGKQWNVISGWIAPDWALLRPTIEQASQQYAEEKEITPRTCTDDSKN